MDPAQIDGDQRYKAARRRYISICGTLPRWEGWEATVSTTTDIT